MSGLFSAEVLLEAQQVTYEKYIAQFEAHKVQLITEFVDELKLYVQEGLMSVTSLLIPNVEIVVTNGIHHRTTASVVDVKRHLSSPKDYMDIVSLGFRP